ncbi:MFS transporter [Saccharopolyspora sp. NPDC002686]|uniref:MFS transporter n=1 Tax=Saccharopolyspora sp. NPDC002686 TaxID=3154541 RepID=UPI00331FBEDD
MTTGPGGLGEPTERVPIRWVLAFSLATVGTFVGWYGPLQILLAKQADAFSPGSKEAVLAVAAGIGALFSMLANPIWGALSDRTASRFGRRIPWVAVGTLGGVAGLLLMAAAQDAVGMIAGWCLVQTALNAPFAALSAAIPDQVPQQQRGTAGGYFGVAQTIGIMAGTGLAVAGGGIVGGYLACAVFVLLAPVPYVLLRRDRVLPAELRPPWSRRAFFAGFWLDPTHHRDFAWAWLTRFLINLSNSITLLYLLFYLQDAVGLPDPGGGVLVLTVIDAVTVLISVMVAGIWSDRIANRRAFVAWSGVIMAIAGFLLAGWQTWTGAVVAALVLGIGFGAYTSVDFALITQVLPEALDRGKDLGVINIANALPQVLAPVVAAPVVAHLGGYPVLYTAASVIALLGGVLVYRVKSVR